MSVKIMGLVWDCDLPREEKFILLAYADHADHDGRNVYPSYGRIAWKTGYTKRHVIRVVEDLAAKGIMVRQGSGPNGTNLWAIAVDRLPQRPDYRAESVQNRQIVGDMVSPPNDTVSPLPGDTVTPPVTQSHTPGDILSRGGDISGTDLSKMSPESSFNRPLNPSINHQMGDSAKKELELVIPGAKVTPKHAWRMVIDQLREGVPKPAFEQYLKALELAEFDPTRAEFIVWAPTEYAATWVKSRVASTMCRFLAGVCNQTVNVEFIFPTAGD